MEYFQSQIFPIPRTKHYVHSPIGEAIILPSAFGDGEEFGILSEIDIGCSDPFL